MVELATSMITQPGNCCMLPKWKCLPHSGVWHSNKFLSQHFGISVRNLPARDLKSAPFICTANSNSHRRNPDFSRQNKGFSRGRSRQNQERENSDVVEETDYLLTKNGPLISLSSNPRYQATAAPGQREKEIVELFRKVQAQLRERAAVKEEKKIEASQQGKGERGTVDSLLKLLRKHSVDQGKRSSNDEEYTIDQQERSNPFEEEQNSNFFETNSFAPDEDIQERVPARSTRPASNFQRRSPVPRIKYQPVYSAEESTGAVSSETSGKKKRNRKDTIKPEADVEPIFLDEPEEESEDEPSDSSDVEEIEEITESSVVVNSDLSSMKLSELRVLAKSRGMKGYSKLKKVELVKLLGGDGT